MEVYHDPKTVLTVVFDLRQPEQAEALHDFRSAFGEAADLEALSEFVFALHISPGSVRRRGAGDAA